MQPHLFVGARRFPVQAIYLEQLLQAVPALRSTCGSSVSKAVNAFESAAKAQAQGGKEVGSLVKAEVSPEMRKVICETGWKLAQADACILVFLPGIGEIGALQDDLEASTHAGVALQVLVLHSLEMYVCLYIHNMLLYTWRCAAGAGAALARYVCMFIYT